MRALVLDDSRATRAILRRQLTQLGFDVVEAGNGIEGLAEVDAAPDLDLALVDWNMPEMDGLSFVQAVRRDATRQRMRLVMVTTESELENIARALAAGADEYVMKPFTADTLLEKLALLGFDQATAR